MCKVFVYFAYLQVPTVSCIVNEKCPYSICSKVSILNFVSAPLSYAIQQHLEYNFECLLVREALFIRVFHCPVLKRMQLTSTTRVESLNTRDDDRGEATCRSLTLLLLAY